MGHDPHSIAAIDRANLARVRALAPQAFGLAPREAKTGKRPAKPRAPGSTGKGLESLVMNNQNGVTFEKVPNGIKYLPGGRTTKVCSPCDFFGVFHRTGRCIVLDAKESSHETNFSCKEDHLREHQRLRLVRMGGSGAVAGLLIEAKAHGRLCWLDWTQLVVRRPTYPWGDLLDVGPSGLAIDWSIVEQADGARKQKAVKAALGAGDD